MATFDWVISNLERDNATGGVTKIHWACTASEGTVGVRDGGAGEVTPDPSASDFIPYADLTKDVVLGWLWGVDNVNKLRIENELQAKLDEMINPTKATGIPWNA